MRGTGAAPGLARPKGLPFPGNMVLAAIIVVLCVVGGLRARGTGVC